MTGIFHCANERCGELLGVDHVTLITTGHVRRFCSVECIAKGQQAAFERLIGWDADHGCWKRRAVRDE